MTLVVVRCQYRSVAADASRAGNGKLRGALKRCFSRFASAPRLFTDARGTIVGVSNLCRALPGWSSFHSLLKHPQKSLSSLCVGLGLSPGFFALRHAEQPKRRPKVWRTQIKGISSP